MILFNFKVILNREYFFRDSISGMGKKHRGFQKHYQCYQNKYILNIWIQFFLLGSNIELYVNT